MACYGDSFTFLLYLSVFNFFIKLDAAKFQTLFPVRISISSMNFIYCWTTPSSFSYSNQCHVLKYNYFNLSIFTLLLYVNSFVILAVLVFSMFKSMQKNTLKYTFFSISQSVSTLDLIQIITDTDAQLPHYLLWLPVNGMVYRLKTL
jgi:hypothetical protein